LKANAHNTILLPEMEADLFALMSVIPLQYLSYQMCLRRGYDPDFPRNLSKTLTVD
jgi:glucosamine--fructose-6-phosphate aminotransferase (isomerizing)